MRWLLPLLLASLLTLGLSVSSVGRGQAPPFRGSFRTRDVPNEQWKAPPPRGRWHHPGTPPLRVRCSQPGTLGLRRFEDGSAQLRCAGRVLVRVAVPG
jgi:hypothetical protein